MKLAAALRSFWTLGRSDRLGDVLKFRVVSAVVAVALGFLYAVMLAVGVLVR